MKKPFPTGVSVLFVVLAFLQAGPAAAEGFSAAQTRFFPNTSLGLDIELSPFGSYAALAEWTSGNSVTVFDGNRELLWRHKQALFWGGTLKKAGVLAFAPDESFLIFPAYRTARDIALVEPRTGRVISVLTGHSGSVRYLSLSPDGSRLATYASNEVFLWRREGDSFVVEGRIPGETAPVTSLAFSPDGSMIALAQFDNFIRRLSLYAVGTGKPELLCSHEREERMLNKEFTALRFSPDGRWLAAGYYDSLTLWRLFPGSGPFEPAQTVADIELGPVISLVFSPDGFLLLSGHNRDVRAYRLSGSVWKIEATFSPHQGAVIDMAFSEDGGTLAIAGRSEAGGLGLWAVTGAGPSPAGRLLALLDNRVSPALRKFFDAALAERVLAALPADDLAPRDMFETAEEFARRREGAGRKAEVLLYDEIERRYGAVREPLSGGNQRVGVPLQEQGKYDIDTKTYTFHFMEEEGSAVLEREAARDLFRGWKEARVLAVRTEGPDGTTYEDFRVRLPGGAEFPLRLSRNPFSGETLDRFGVRVPSLSVGPDLLVRNLAVEGVFPALLHHYAKNSIGSLELRNIGSSVITGLSVRFHIPGLQQNPVLAEAPESLGVGQDLKVDLRAHFDSSILAQTGAGSAAAEVTIGYTSRGAAHRETVSRPISVLNRNAVRWNDDRKAAAFMTVNDPGLLRWSAGVSGMAGGTVTSVLTRNLHTAIVFFEALRAAGVSYVVDPASPYQALSRDGEALDFIRFPLETLDQRGGDCDDLSVLYASLLESVGVPSAFITTPGHILAAFELGLYPEEAAKAFGTAEFLIFRDGRAWVPVETTLLSGGFTAAWQAGVSEWKKAEAAGSAAFFTAREAWEVYPPVDFSAGEGTAMPPKERVEGRYNEELTGFRKAVIGPREKEILAELARSPSAAAENRLGVLYARFGMLDEAFERFKRALASKEYLPAMINTANVHTLRREYDKAMTVLSRAREMSPDDVRVLIALAVSHLHAGENTAAKEAYDRAARVNPAVAAKYPLFGPAETAPGGVPAAGETARAGAVRAARETGGTGTFGGEWTDED